MAKYKTAFKLKVAQAVQAAGENTAICTLCTKEPTRDYFAVIHPPAGPGTYRLCDAWYRSHSAEESLAPFPWPDAPATGRTGWSFARFSAV